MLSYELCKKLKAAGFPQNGSKPMECSCGNYVYKSNQVAEYKNGSELVANPTLSELIEACGNKFIALEYLQRKGLKPGWSIVGKDIRNENVFNGGATPEEAVANLWLAINCSSEAEKADIAITNLWLALNKKK